MSSIISEIKKIPKLPNEEIVNLVVAAQNGDEEARQKIIKHHLYLVSAIAYEQSQRKDAILRGIDADDLFSEGCFGLMRAVNNYNTEVEGVFPAFAYTYILNEMRTYIRAAKAKVRDVSQNKSMSEPAFVNKDGDEKTLEEYIPDKSVSVEDEIFNSVFDENLRRTLKRLTKEEQEFIMLRYGFNGSTPLTLREMGELYKVSYQTIANREEKILTKLRHPNITKGLKDFI